MKISYNWIKEFIGTALFPEEAGALLTGSGLEVENIEEFESVKGGLKGLVIGEIKTCVKHPDADKLHLTTVDTGSGELSTIVCGAPNVAAGQKVVVALPGTKIFPTEGEPFVIKQAKIRGQVSNGMICAEDEIGLGRSHEGLIILPADAKTGTPASEYFRLQSDSIFEIGLTPNRSDAASHLGVARDLAAVIRVKKLIDTGKDEKINLCIPSTGEQRAGKIKKEIKVVVEDPVACPRYSGITIANVKVSGSPAWLKDRLKSIGVNPINNIVDITNYVLHECGQPLHAFDADKIKGEKIVVRSARKDEKFVTLDNVERTLQPGDLMICDESISMCIAGVYGGLNSGINESSKNIFIESACFNPASIRKTSKRHGLKTDASFRFERGTDPNMTLYALRRATALICEIAGGEVASSESDFYPSPLKPPVVKLDYGYLDKFSGEKIDRKVVRTILDSLEIKINSEDTGFLNLEIPLFKVDVTRPADVIEEILRVYGYDRIPVPGKLNASIPSQTQFDKEQLLKRVSVYLSANGFNEILTNSLTKAEYASLSRNEDTLVKILNPLSNDLSVLRQDLLATALETVQYNVNRKQQDLRFFEYGKTYFKTNAGYNEEYHLSVLMTGNRQEPSWISKDADVDYFLLKAYVDHLLVLCGIQNPVISKGIGKSFATSQAVSKGQDILVEYGVIHRSVLKEFDLQRDVLYADFYWDAILKHCKKKPVQYSEISKFPAVKRDLSMLIGKEISFSQLESIAYKTERKLLKEIRLFDVYEGEKLEPGKKSYALTFILQDDQQTLTEQQISKTMDRLMNAFEKEAGAVIRKN